MFENDSYSTVYLRVHASLCMAVCVICCSVRSKVHARTLLDTSYSSDNYITVMTLQWYWYCCADTLSQLTCTPVANSGEYFVEAERDVTMGDERDRQTQMERLCFSDDEGDVEAKNGLITTCTDQSYEQKVEHKKQLSKLERQIQRLKIFKTAILIGVWVCMVRALILLLFANFPAQSNSRFQLSECSSIWNLHNQDVTIRHCITVQRQTTF